MKNSGDILPTPTDPAQTTPVAIHFQAMLEAAPDAIVIANVAGYIVLVNAQTEKLFGYNRQNLIGCSIEQLLPPRFHSQHLQHRTTYLANPHRRPMGTGLELYGLHSDGSEFPVEISLSPLQTETGLLVISAIRDVSQRKQAEAALHRRNQYLSTLHHISLELLNRRELDDLLQTIVERAAELLDAPYAEISLVEAESLVVRAFTRNQSFLQGDRVQRGEGLLTWQVYDSREPVVLNNYTEWPNRRPIYEQIQLRAVADLPILVGQKCLGVLGLARTEPDYPFDFEQIQAGLWFAQLAALVLDNTQLYVATQRELAERRRTEAALHASEAELRALFAAMPDVILTLSHEGRYLKVASTGTQLLYRPAIEMLGKTVDEVLPQPFATMFVEHIQHSLATGQIVSLEYMLSIRGQELWFEGRISPLLTDNSVMLVARDITERKRLEEALREREAQLRSLADNLPNGTIYQVVQKPDGSIYFPYMSAGVERIFGVTARQVMASAADFYSLILTEDLPRIRAAEAESLRLMSVFDEEFRQRTLSGRVKWVHCRSAPRRLADGAVLWDGVMLDITERKLIEQALQESEQFLQDTLNALSAHVAILDEQGVIVQVNEAWREFAWQNNLTHPNYGIGLNYLTVCDTATGDGSKGAAEAAWGIRAVISEQLESFWLEYSNHSPTESRWFVLRVTRFTGQNGTRVVLTHENITARVLAEEALRQSEERYALAARGANDGLWDWDLQNNRIYFSPRWKAMLGYEEDEITQTVLEWFSRVHPDDLEPLQIALWSHLHQETAHFEFEYRLLHRDGNYRWMLCRGLAVFNINGWAERIAGSQTDITRRKVAEAQLQHDAFHDALTGLPNRALFMDHLARSMGHAQRRQNYQFAVLFVDLDQFKLINDSLGHVMGDVLLMTIAHRLAKCVRLGDTVARLGGDEFVILLDDLQDAAEAWMLSERIQHAIAEPVNLAGRQVGISSSVGFVLGQNDPLSPLYEQPADLLRDADIAMYQAKTQGRARVEQFNLDMRVRAMGRLVLETQLRQAFERQEFQIFYQPIIATANSRIVGVEALLRWQHPERGLIYPVEFISTLEETGLLIPVGEWILGQVCAQLQQWRRAGYNHLRGAVNLSVRQLQDTSLPQRIEHILNETGLAADGLELEVTETVAMQSMEASMTTLNQLRALGLHLAIDDFGVGYSSLSRLQRLPVSILKIDRSFVSDLTNQTTSGAITSAIIAMGHHLGLRITAEGVETEKQLTVLRTQECDEVQGYFFSPPVPAEKLTQLLKRY